MKKSQVILTPPQKDWRLSASYTALVIFRRFLSDYGRRAQCDHIYRISFFMSKEKVIIVLLLLVLLWLGITMFD